MIVKTNYANIQVMLVDEANRPVELGEKFTLRDGTEYELVDARAPHKLGSTGRVYVAENSDRYTREYFPSVIGCRWVGVDETAHGGHFGDDDGNKQ